MTSSMMHQWELTKVKGFYYVQGDERERNTVLCTSKVQEILMPDREELPKRLRIKASLTKFIGARPIRITINTGRYWPRFHPYKWWIMPNGVQSLLARTFGPVPHRYTLWAKAERL